MREPCLETDLKKPTVKDIYETTGKLEYRNSYLIK